MEPETTVFFSPAFIQYLGCFCIGILAGFVSSAMIQTPRWIVAMLNS